MKKPLVSIIIVNWNGKHFLRDCLGSLSQISYKNIEIIFVDNASSDGSVDFVRKNFPDVNIIENETNLGFAQGNGVGFKKTAGEAVLILNTDTVVEKNFLDELVTNLYKKRNIGAIQPKILMYPQKNRIDSVGAFFLTNGILYHYGREKDPNLPIYNKQMEVYSAKGVCILFKKKALLKTELFDKDYFAYFEETDLCHRIWLAGYRIIYTPRSVVYHCGGGSSKQMVASFIYFHSYKNKICTYIKNLSPKYLFMVIPQLILFFGCATFVYVSTGKFSIAWAVLRGIGWNVLNIKQTLQKRNFVQKNIRVLKDDEFLPRLIRPVRLSYYYYVMFGGLENYRD